MREAYPVVAGVALALGSLRCLAQAPPPAAPAPTPAPIAIESASGPFSCPYCDLRGKNLAGQNLTNANLIGSDLRGANLAGATFDGAALIGADLAGADLSGAHLTKTTRGPADLTNANLAGARFHQAVLTGAQLPFAGLEGADFGGADLTGAVLGPLPKVGAQTSFRGARMDRRSALGAGVDLSGVIWNEPKAAAATPGPGGVTCGGSDLSGVANPVFVSPQGTDTDTCGANPATACKTLVRALSRCSASSCTILAMFGEYALPATLAFNSQTTPAAARLVGGCVPSEQTEAGLSSLISAPPGGAPVASVDGVKPVVLENFKILGSVAAGTNGASAVTLLIARTPEIVLTNSMVVGGGGGAGATGAAQPPGA
jgi:uncharacterized protein YjbI with pentapeptide repeats